MVVQIQEWDPDHENIVGKINECGIILCSYRISQSFEYKHSSIHSRPILF